MFKHHFQAMEVDSESRLAIEAISNKIKSCKVDMMLSNRKLGSHCLMTEATIRNILKGIPNIELSTLTKLRLAFGMSLKELLDEEVNFYRLKRLPITDTMYQTTFVSDKKKIGKRIGKLMKFRKLDPENLSILSDNVDYSKTLKYLKGMENITLITIMKYAHGLEVSFASILDFNGQMPINSFIGKIKKEF